MNIESLIESYSRALNNIDTNDYQTQINKIKADYGSVSENIATIGSGASVGALAGGTAASFVPGLGTAVGAGVGGIGGATISTLKLIGSSVFEDLDVSYEKKEVDAQIKKMQSDCTALASVISSSANKKITEAINYLEDSKKLISKQTVQGSNGKNQRVEIISLLNKEISNLKRLHTLNIKFIAKLQQLSKTEK